MQVSLNNPPKVSLVNHPNYRVVKVSDRQGQVGMLLPHANLLVPDKQVIRDLKEIIQLYQKLKPEPFNYGTSSGYRKHLVPPPATGKPVEFDRIDDLPLFAKRYEPVVRMEKVMKSVHTRLKPKRGEPAHDHGRHYHPYFLSCR